MVVWFGSKSLLRRLAISFPIAARSLMRDLGWGGGIWSPVTYKAERYFFCRVEQPYRRTKIFEIFGSLPLFKTEKYRSDNVAMVETSLDLSENCLPYNLQCSMPKLPSLLRRNSASGSFLAECRAESLELTLNRHHHFTQQS